MTKRHRSTVKSKPAYSDCAKYPCNQIFVQSDPAIISICAKCPCNHQYVCKVSLQSSVFVKSVLAIISIYTEYPCNHQYLCKVSLHAAPNSFFFFFPWANTYKCLCHRKSSVFVHRPYSLIAAVRQLVVSSAATNSVCVLWYPCSPVGSWTL